MNVAAKSGGTFIGQVLAGRAFQRTGVAYGRTTDCWWAVVDPVRHPLEVWQGAGSYSKTARDLGVAVFTNGPMMGKRFATGRKVTKGSVAREFALWTSAGALIGGGAGALIGAVRAWRRVLSGWVPCGIVRGTRAGIDDRRDFDGEGITHGWIGRSGLSFGSYRVGMGNLPPGVVEGSGGMVPLLQGFAPLPGRFSQKRGVAAWALVPLAPGGPLEGVVVVLGSHRFSANEAALWLQRIGARDAVAADQSGCAMMGAERRFMLGPPPPHRQAIQRYGLCCR